MTAKKFLKTGSIVLWLVFVFSILTVESHASETGSLAAQLPTIIDGTIEFAVTIDDTVELDVLRAVEYLVVFPEALSVCKALTPPQIYRAPPRITL